MADQELLEAIEQEIDNRSNQLTSSDPTIAYLRGALDFANGNIQIKEGVEDGIKSTAVKSNVIKDSKS